VNGDVDPDLYLAKRSQLTEQAAALESEAASIDRLGDEVVDVAVKTFELAESQEKPRVSAECAERRNLLRLVFSNLTWDGVTLFPVMRGPSMRSSKGLPLLLVGPTGFEPATSTTPILPYKSKYNCIYTTFFILPAIHRRPAWWTGMDIKGHLRTQVLHLLHDPQGQPSCPNVQACLSACR
jgi:hypothetical protein